MIHSKNLCLISIALIATYWAGPHLSSATSYFFLIFQKPSCLLHLLADCLMAASPESHPTTLSPPPQLYPEDLQLKLYQAFIFSIPVLFAIILFLLFYLFYLKRSASATHSPPTAPPILPITLNQPTSSAPTHFDTDLKLKGDLKSELSTVFFDDYLKAKDSL
ncbi:hypothetical protein ACH5RR_030942 [Cinchona calisaya]|uniref:Uncharacterized protein n=1 Tax=Cinchona calisaya TaxID=153742 RepID=A0ABD2YH71_9GENT